MVHVLTAKDLLDLWERGLRDQPLQRVLDLLAIAYPELSYDQLRDLPIGQRDLRLLTIREALFGSRLNCLTTCPKCSERLEIAFDISQFRTPPLDSALIEPHLLTADDYEIQFRLPNSSDLLWISGLPDITQARRTLFERCIQQAKHSGVSISATDVPDELVNATSIRMAELDPQADIQIALTCPACSQPWTAVFDITSYLWIEINAWAMRLLREVHQLASAYGWREADILALSPIRRQLYLELIG